MFSGWHPVNKVWEGGATLWRVVGLLFVITFFLENKGDSTLITLCL